MARSIEELRRLSDSELVSEHDALAGSTQVGVSYYLEEIRRREGARREKLMLRLTVAIFALTLVNTIAVVASIG